MKCPAIAAGQARRYTAYYGPHFSRHFAYFPTPHPRHPQAQTEYAELLTGGPDKGPAYSELAGCSGACTQSYMADLIGRFCASDKKVSAMGKWVWAAGDMRQTCSRPIPVSMAVIKITRETMESDTYKRSKARCAIAW
eukprot:1159557-Pelagomonas_calceolata.AAC.22